MTTTECPNSDIGVHRYFMFKTFETFEPVIVEQKYNLSPNDVYYRKVDIAILGCNCGASIRTVVKQQ